MSIKIMSRVWESSRHKGSTLVLALAIADFADDNGRAFPSVSTLAKKCRMTERNVQLLLERLVAAKDLAIRPNEGPHGVHVYQLFPGENFSGVKSFRTEKHGARTPKIPASRGEETGPELSPKPSVPVIEPSEEPPVGEIIRTMPQRKPLPEVPAGLICPRCGAAAADGDAARAHRDAAHKTRSA